MPDDSPHQHYCPGCHTYSDPCRCITPQAVVMHRLCGIAAFFRARRQCAAFLRSGRPCPLYPDSATEAYCAVHRPRLSQPPS